jgi:peptidoglycan L-alanyl-D-glutamate endopeptidase CwlK
MAFKLGPRSLLNLRGVHPDLVRVVKRAISISDIDFTVIEGLRSVSRQKELFAKGATKTMRSRHIHGFAVDIAPYVAGSIRWDWPLFDKIEEAMKKAAKLENVSVTWGGDWKSFKDGPHWELPHAKYPDPK